MNRSLAHDFLQKREIKISMLLANVQREVDT